MINYMYSLEASQWMPVGNTSLCAKESKEEWGRYVMEPATEHHAPHTSILFVVVKFFPAFAPEQGSAAAPALPCDDQPVSVGAIVIHSTLHDMNSLNLPL
jgi:hypothetical protein